MAHITTKQHLAFMINCVQHSNNGKVDFAAVAKDCNIVSKEAAAKRYSRLLKANSASASASTEAAETGNGDDEAETGSKDKTKAKAKTQTKTVRKRKAAGEGGQVKRARATGRGKGNGDGKVKREDEDGDGDGDEGVAGVVAPESEEDGGDPLAAVVKDEEILGEY